jgi:hypothetical protein
MQKPLCAHFTWKPAFIGMGIVMGLNPLYAYQSGWCSLPSVSNTFCVWDGQTSSVGDYVSPDLYFETRSGMNITRSLLSSNPSLNYSMFAWCGQPGDWDSTAIKAYLDSMNVLEASFPQ